VTHVPHLPPFSVAPANAPGALKAETSAVHSTFSARAGGSRDLILDFLRGLAIFSMVTDHLLFVSGFSYLTRERIGVVTGAELFVLISGVLIGHLYKQKIAKFGFKAAAMGLLRRAAQLYVVCLAIIVGVFLFSLIPGVDTKLATPWGMFNLRGVIHSYGMLRTIQHILLLKCGPLRMNVIGIYVVLMAGAPIALWMLTRGRGKLLLLLSGFAWVANLKFEARLSNTLFDSVFRVVSWQFLFVIGMIAGYHRVQLREFLLSTRGRLLLLAAAVLCVGFCLFALHNPDMDLSDTARLHLIPDHVFKRIYETFFSRKVLSPGRMVNVICLFSVGYVFLREFWPLIDKWFGWFFVTIGQASLYVYILHVFLLQGVYQLPWFDEGNVWINTAGTTGVLLLLWGMTKKKVLFWLIPR